MMIYLVSLPIWNFVLPTYAYWKFDDFTWGDTRKTAGETKKGGHEDDGEFDSSKITMKRWQDFEHGTYRGRRWILNAETDMRSTERRIKSSNAGWSQQSASAGGGWPAGAQHQQQQQQGYEAYY